jgi:cytidylate kinase
MSETATAASAQEETPSRASRRLPKVIAVDGSAASGKSSIGRRLAAHLGYPFLDTGVMYRAVTFAALDRRVDVTDDGALGAMSRKLNLDVEVPEPGSEGEAVISIEGTDVTPYLRRQDVEDAVSLVSRVPGVRDSLVRQQREIAARKAIVMAGRDIGTVVLPDADLKLYLDASLNERAGRRHREFESLGREVTQEDVLADIQRRDQIDSERDVSPLRPADDAVVINTDGLTLDEVFERVVKIAEGRE